MPRKLNTQIELESSTVPTPSAASSAAPRRATKAVSTSPVIGSAMSETMTGSVRTARVR
jgi:hypothetical protein